MSKHSDKLEELLDTAERAAKLALLSLKDILHDKSTDSGTKLRAASEINKLLNALYDRQELGRRLDDAEKFRKSVELQHELSKDV